MEQSIDGDICAGCEDKPAVDSGLCNECADWCAEFFTTLFPPEND